MFTAKNFRRIFDTENRKGQDLAGQFFPDLEPHTLAIKDKAREIRKIRRKGATFKPEEFFSKIADLKLELKELKLEKSSAIDAEMRAISSEVLKSGFKLALTRKTGPKGKPVFCIDGTPETYFCVKQLQWNINKIYGVKQSNRHDLVCQLRDTVASSFPFEIVRTDVSSFYESIDRECLLQKLDKDHLLSSSSKKYIRQILNSYGQISKSDRGIPRGVGVSAYLAELYLRPVDKGIKAISDIVLYCRYVDDIVAVFARPPSGAKQVSYKDSILKILAARNLNHNPEKTNEFNLGKSGKKKFEYLGYRFVLDSGKCDIWPSASKIRKYKARMSAAFKEYEADSSLDSHRAYRDLVSRIKFLTGNTRLANSKSSAVTGIYFNNPLITNVSSFRLLDKHLRAHIKKVQRPKLRRRLKMYKFTEGFSQRRFHNFSARELQSIVRVWKHG